MRSTTSRPGGPARRLLRAAALLGATGAAAVGVSLALAAPAHADDAGSAASGPRDLGGLVGRMNEPVADVTRPVARPARQVVRHVAHQVTRPVAQPVAQPAPPRPRPTPAPAPSAATAAAPEAPARAQAAAAEPVAETTLRVTQSVREVRTTTRAALPAAARVTAPVDPTLDRALEAALDGVDRVGVRVGAVAAPATDLLGPVTDAVASVVRGAVVQTLGPVVDRVDELVPAVEGAAAAQPRATSARTGHREPVVPLPEARGGRAHQTVPALSAVPAADVPSSATPSVTSAGGDTVVDDPARAPRPELPSYAGPPAPTPLGSASATAAYLADGPTVGDHTAGGLRARDGDRVAALQGRGPGCTPD